MCEWDNYGAYVVKRATKSFSVSLCHLFVTERSALRGPVAIPFRSARRPRRSIWAIHHLLYRSGRWRAGERRHAPGRGRARCTAEQGVAKDAALSAFRKKTFGASCSLHRRQRAQPPDLRHERRHQPQLRLTAAATRTKGLLHATRFRVAPSRCVEATRNWPAPTFCAWRREKPRRGTHQV